MPKPLTPADRRLREDLRTQLRLFLRVPGMTKAELAKRLELSTQGVEDLLNEGRVSGIRTLALAVDRCGVRLRYPGTDCLIGRVPRGTGSMEKQMELPFIVSSPDPNVGFRVGSLSDKSITVNLTLRKA